MVPVASRTSPWPSAIRPGPRASTAGAVTEQGEFVPGEPYLFARDPEGYTLELWFELPTRFDPPARRR